MKSAIKNNPKAYAKWLISCGVEAETAYMMSGYKPELERRRELRKRVATYVMSIVIVVFTCVAVAFSLWASITAAQAEETDVTKHNEAMLAQCLSGKPIRVGDTYFTCSEMRIPK